MIQLWNLLHKMSSDFVQKVWNIWSALDLIYKIQIFNFEAR